MLSNNILSGNANVCSGFAASGSNNLVTDTSCGSGGLLVGSAATTAAALKLGALAGNGRPTQTIALATGSVAVDAGDASVCSSAPVSGADQRGVARPQGAACDVGALEARQGNLQAIKTATNASILVGGTTTFSLSARNLAAAPDAGGLLTDTVPSRLRVDSVTPSGGTVCTTAGNAVSCTLPTLAQNDVATVDIATTALTAGDASNSATARTGAEVDGEPANDSDTAAVTVIALDTTPSDFGFTAVNGVARNSVQTSNAVTIGGINAAAAITVSTGSEYPIGCTGSFTSAAGSIENNQSVCVRHTASASFATDTVTTLTIGAQPGGSPGASGSFTSTTLARDITPEASASPT